MAKMNGTLYRIPADAVFLEDPTTPEEPSDFKYAT
jgi:hypothetical protein